MLILNKAINGTDQIKFLPLIKFSKYTKNTDLGSNIINFYTCNYLHVGHTFRDISTSGVNCYIIIIIIII